MRQIGQKVLDTAARVSGGRIGAHAETVASATTMAAGLQRLAGEGVELLHVVDGGAFRGGWTQIARRVFPRAACVMVEPQPRVQAELRRLCAAAPVETHLVQAVLGAGARESVEFFVLDDPFGGTGSSMLRETSTVPGHVERVPMDTLERILDQIGFPPPDLVKLDVQGYEIEALKGLGERLAEVPYLLLEVATWQYNEGAPLLDEVVGWLRLRDFVTHDLLGETRLPDGTLAQVDLLFARADTPVRRHRTITFA